MAMSSQHDDLLVIACNLNNTIAFETPEPLYIAIRASDIAMQAPNANYSATVSVLFVAH